MKKVLCLLMLLVCVGLAQGAILQDMGDSGQFSRDALAISTAPGSYWSSHRTANATLAFVNDGGPAPSNYAEMGITWYPRSSSIWYVDAAASGATEEWAVSADVAAVLGGNQNGDRFMRLGTLTSPGVFASPWAFEMNFMYVNNTIIWQAGSLSGTTSMGTMSRDWVNAEISYNAATGVAVGTFGGAPVFNVTTTPGMTVNTVYFSRYNDSTHYDTGTMKVDNVTAYIIPEPATLTLLALASGWALRRRR